MVMHQGGGLIETIWSQTHTTRTRKILKKYFSCRFSAEQTIDYFRGMVRAHRQHEDANCLLLEKVKVILWNLQTYDLDSTLSCFALCSYA